MVRCWVTMDTWIEVLKITLPETKILLMEDIPNNHLACVKPCRNPVDNGINYISTGAGFLPSTVAPENRPKRPKRKLSYSNHPFSGAFAVSFREGKTSFPFLGFHNNRQVLMLFMQVYIIYVMKSAIFTRNNLIIHTQVVWC